MQNRLENRAMVALLLLAILTLNACGSASNLTPTSTVSSTTTTIPPNTTAIPLPATPIISSTSTETSTSVPALITNTPTQIPATTNGAGLASNQPIPTTGCGKAAPITPGLTENVTIAANPSGARGSATRSYRLHLSAKYKPNESEAILLVFHGHGGSAADMEAGSGFSTLADQQGFITVYPQGVKDDDGLPMWANVGPAADYGIDDLTFTNDMINKFQKELCVDPSRIYATGFSNGGGMSHYLACRLAGRIAAVVPIAGNYFVLPDGGCQPSRAVALLEIHGTADNVIAYNGRPDKDFPGWPLPSMPNYLAEWAKRNGCTTGPQIFLDTSEVKGEEWAGCRDNSTVAHYQMKGGGHSYPASINGRPGSEVIWSFLYQHVRS